MPPVEIGGAVIHVGDCRDVLRALAAQGLRAQTCVTSPPYWGLRDYGVDGQIGLESTLGEFVQTMVEVFREVRDVLADDGTLWLNLGDSYISGGGIGFQGKHGERYNRTHTQRALLARMPEASGLKPKDLAGVPWRVAFALQADGWVLRQETIWSKPNPMPESVRDRCTKSHEQLFLFAKAKWSGPQPGRFARISDEDARWLALLIDAEGCIVVKRNKHEGRSDTFAPQVSIGNTSEALMHEVVRIVGHGSLLERRGKNCRMLYWQVANGLARDLLHRLYPFFIVKQRQARIGIHVDSLTYFRGGKAPERKQRTATEQAILESLWARNKECNSFGHPDLSDVPEPEFGRWADCERYFYDADAIREPQESLGERHNDKSGYREGHPSKGGISERKLHPLGRNKRTVWTVATQPFGGAHFATFPTALIEPCILAGSRRDDIVLDPFNGAGTTGVVALRNGRRYVGIELNPEYVDITRRRMSGPDEQSRLFA